MRHKYDLFVVLNSKLCAGEPESSGDKDLFANNMLINVKSICLCCVAVLEDAII
jgi:hypothetical protein